MSIGEVGRRLRNGKSMLQQAFSVESLHRIIRDENARGRYIEGEFFPEVAILDARIKAGRDRLREEKARCEIGREAPTPEIEGLSRLVEGLLEDRIRILDAELQRICHQLHGKRFRLALREEKPRKDKDVFSVGDDPASVLATKQVQRHLASLFQVKQRNRFEVLCEIKGILSDGFPKQIIRTDIQGCYESIPRLPLLQMLDREAYLSKTSRYLIKQVLSEYSRLSRNPEGIPRGVGISAYLCEAYLSTLDEVFRKRKDVIYYARYVDDIIIVALPGLGAASVSYVKLLDQELHKLKLRRNETKTEELIVRDSQNATFTYLGYKINISQHAVKFEHSNEKIRKYKHKIDLAFQAYSQGLIRNEKSARKLLVKRIRYLTCNTRLRNNKRHALIGSFYSNSALTSDQAWRPIDAHLQRRICELENEACKQRLSKLSFQRGFSERTFVAFSLRDLGAITKVWNRES